MRTFKTVTISLPIEMGMEIEKAAKEEHRTVSELLREAFRRYQSQKNLTALASEGRASAKKKKLSPKDLGDQVED